MSAWEAEPLNSSSEEKNLSYFCPVLCQKKWLKATGERIQFVDYTEYELGFSKSSYFY